MIFGIPAIIIIAALLPLLILVIVLVSRWRLSRLPMPPTVPAPNQAVPAAVPIVTTKRRKPIVWIVVFIVLVLIAVFVLRPLVLNRSHQLTKKSDYSSLKGDRDARGDSTTESSETDGDIVNIVLNADDSCPVSIPKMMSDPTIKVTGFGQVRYGGGRVSNGPGGDAGLMAGGNIRFPDCNHLEVLISYDAGQHFQRLDWKSDKPREQYCFIHSAKAGEPTPLLHIRDSYYADNSGGYTLQFFHTE